MEIKRNSAEDLAGLLFKDNDFELTEVDSTE